MCGTKTVQRLIAIFSAISFSAISPPVAAASVTERVSLSNDGTQLNQESAHPALSADGRYVIFKVREGIFSTNLFLHDRISGTTNRISIAGSDQMRLGSGRLSISENGQYIVFSSSRSDLVPNDTFSLHDLFLFDRENDTVQLLNVRSDGTTAEMLGGPSGVISANGRFVAFVAYDSRMVPDKTHTYEDIFVRDVVLGITERVSVSSEGMEGDSGSYSPSISADGRFVAFHSYSKNLVPDDTNGEPDAFVHDRVTKSTIRVSVASDGAQGNGVSGAARISANGRFIAFSSQSSNLVPNDTNGTSDVFIHDRITGITARVSERIDGAQADDQSQSPSISADGRYVGFMSAATNLVDEDTNQIYDFFVRDLATGIVERVNVTSSGEQANYWVGSWMTDGLQLSADGRFSAFESGSSNLVINDTNGVIDIFLRDRGTFQPLEEPQTRPGTGVLGPFVSFSSEPVEPMTENVIILVHGWLSSSDVWPETLKEIILREATSPPNERWVVATLDWSDAAYVPNTWLAYSNAVDIGKSLGRTLERVGFDRIHFVAHSAGSALVESAAFWLREHASKQPAIHTTLLDAYHPFPELSTYGANANWAEHYVDRRYEGLGLSNTNSILRNAYNFDVTSLDDRSWLLPGFGAHEWPYVWYQRTAENPSLWNYGWGASNEYDSSRLPSHSDLMRGGECVIVAPDTVCSEPGYTITELQLTTVPNPFDVWQNPSSVQVTQSDTGTVSVSTPQQLVLTVGSPVWVTFAANVTEPFNTLRFSYEYLSGVDGLLSVFFDDQLVFRSDQRNADEGLDQSGLVPLGEINPGTHALSFRLDHYSESKPSIRISDMSVGNASFVESMNVAPIAHAGPDQTLVVGGLVELDGSQSSDPDGGPLPLVYEWSQVSGPTVALRNAMSHNASFVALLAGTYTLSLTVHDGHQSSVPSIVRVVAEGGDPTAPTVTYSTSGVLGTNGWYLDDVTVTWIVDDGGAAISSLNGCDPVTVSKDTEGLALVCTATNSVGTSSEQIVIRRDTTSPVITVNAPANGMAYTQSSNVAASYSCFDSLSGIANCVGTIASGALLDTSTVGSRSFSVNATDSAGNTTSAQVTYEVVASPGGGATVPTITHSTSRALGASGWYTDDVTVTWTIYDGGAAISSSTGCGPVTVSTDTAALVLVCTATNSVGTSSEQVELRRDSTNPVIAISAPTNGATYTQSTSVAANYSCTDSLSGIASCIGTIANGAPLDTSALGSRSFSVNATDDAGNSASIQVTYQVVAASEDSSGGGGGGALDHWTLLFLSIFGLGALSRRRQAH